MKFLIKAALWLGLLAAVVGLVMALWNWLMPALFTNAQPITYWQALGILVLSKILFGGAPGHWRGRHPHWNNMTAQEREQIRRHFKRRWGAGSDGRFGAHETEDSARCSSYSTSPDLREHKTDERGEKA